MAVGDFRISNEIKNAILKSVYTLGAAAGANSGKIFLTLNHNTSNNQLAQFSFVDGVATLNGSVAFDVIVDGSPITINKIFIGTGSGSGVYNSRAEITLQGDEIKTFNESGMFAIMSLSIQLNEVNG